MEFQSTKLDETFTKDLIKLLASIENLKVLHLILASFSSDLVNGITSECKQLQYFQQARVISEENVDFIIWSRKSSRMIIADRRCFDIDFPKGITEVDFRVAKIEHFELVAKALEQNTRVEGLFISIGMHPGCESVKDFLYEFFVKVLEEWNMSDSREKISYTTEGFVTEVTKPRQDDKGSKQNETCLTLNDASYMNAGFCEFDEYYLTFIFSPSYPEYAESTYFPVSQHLVDYTSENEQMTELGLLPLLQTLRKIVIHNKQTCLKLFKLFPKWAENPKSFPNLAIISCVFDKFDNSDMAAIPFKSFEKLNYRPQFVHIQFTLEAEKCRTRYALHGDTSICRLVLGEHVSSEVNGLCFGQMDPPAADVGRSSGGNMSDEVFEWMDT